MNIELTDAADYLLCVLYDAYRQNIKQGLSPDEARTFGTSEDIQKDLIQHWSTYEIDAAAFALDEAELIDGGFEAGELFASYLTNRGIAYMDHKFGRNADKLLHYIGELAAIIAKIRSS